MSESRGSVINSYLDVGIPSGEVFRRELDSDEFARDMMDYLLVNLQSDDPERTAKVPRGFNPWVNRCPLTVVVHAAYEPQQRVPKFVPAIGVRTAEWLPQPQQSLLAGVGDHRAMPGTMAGSMVSERSARSLAPPPSMSGVSRAGAAATTAENIGRATVSLGTRAKVSDLEDLSQRFVPFYRELEQGVQEVYEGQEDRLTGIERWVQRIERSLVTEQQRRIEMFGLVETNLQAQVESLGKMWQAQIAELAPDIPARIGTWHERLAVADRDIGDERERRSAAIERERVRLLKQVEDLQRRLEVSKVERLEREALLLKKIIDENDGMGRLIDDERSKRESTLGHLRDENDMTARVSEKPNQLFKEDMIGRMVSATTNIKKETLQRVGAERNFVESLEIIQTRGHCRPSRGRGPHWAPREVAACRAPCRGEAQPDPRPAWLLPPGRLWYRGLCYYTATGATRRQFAAPGFQTRLAGPAVTHRPPLALAGASRGQSA
eukprot:scaffold16912_cov112-Isochrysis_galbana.AAC.10